MATAKTIRAVCVWRDTQSGPSIPGGEWIVSQDELDDRFRAETSKTLSTHGTEADAIEAGRIQAAALRLPLYRNPEHGTAELLEPAPSNAD